MRKKSLRILVLGNLGPNKERILALKNQVERLVYVYTEYDSEQDKLDTIVQYALPRKNALQFVKKILFKDRINIIYSLLNSHDESTEATLEILDSDIEIPIVRHYKEHPCFPTREEKRLLEETTAQIYINTESFEYFKSVYDINSKTAHILDADLISERYMIDNLQPKLRFQDNKPHLLIAGSLSALNDRLDMRELCLEMSKRDICVHLYGRMVSKNLEGDVIFDHIETELKYRSLSDQHDNIELHSFIKPRFFSFEWSKYDLGYMHSRVTSKNPESEFEKINFPYRYTSYLSAGLPICLPDIGQDAMKRFVLENEIGFSHKDYDQLAELLYDFEYLDKIQMKVKHNRRKYSFEANIEHLIKVFSLYCT